jgi:Xaa-Pro dipeptidase
MNDVTNSAAERLQRCLDEMKRRDVDVLLLGRESNARYLTGATRLWLAGTRPFGPGCLVVRDTGAVHLLSTTDDLVPLPPEQLFPMSWNPANLVAALGSIPGVAGARRVGVDGMSPGFQPLLRGLLADAELVDGEDLLASVRRIKSSGDVAAIKDAIEVAEKALGAVLGSLAPGLRERDLVARYVEATGNLGVTTPAFDPVFHVVDRGPGASFSGPRALADGDLVDAWVGVLANGWVGRLARTWPCGAPTAAHGEASAAWQEGCAPVVAAIRPGTTVGQLRGHGAEVRGVGAGDELLDDEDPLEPGMVLAVGVRREGIHAEDTYLVTDGGYDLLTTFPHEPA